MKRTSPFRLLAWLLPVGALVWTGCRVAKEALSVPEKMVTAVVPQGTNTSVDPVALEAQLQRFADNFSAQTVAALDEYVRRVGTPEARSQALIWKVSVGSAVVQSVSGPHPMANLLDVLALASIMRTALEHWVATRDGAALQPWLEVSRTLETNVWQLAEGNLTPEQQQELRDSIRQWWESRPDAGVTFFERPQTFSSLIQQSGQPTEKTGSVFGLVGLDPMAGLDPAVREVTRTRLFAERVMYTAQHMPFLLRWQIEVLADQLLRMQSVKAALDSADRLSRAAESASQTAATLPDRVTAERQAILAALEAQEGRLRELSAEVTRTLAAGEQMAASLNTTLITFDGLMKRFGVGEPKSGPQNTNATPFSIRDYAHAAGEITTMAQQLDALIKDLGNTLDSPALDQRIAGLKALSEQAKADARSVLNHACLLAAGLLVLAFVLGTVYRRTGRAKPGNQPPAQTLRE